MLEKRNEHILKDDIKEVIESKDYHCGQNNIIADESEKNLRKCPHFCEYCGEIVNTEDENKCVSHKGFFENKTSKGGVTDER